MNSFESRSNRSRSSSNQSEKKMRKDKKQGKNFEYGDIFLDQVSEQEILDFNRMSLTSQIAFTNPIISCGELNSSSLNFGDSDSSDFEQNHGKSQINVSQNQCKKKRNRRKNELSPEEQEIRNNENVIKQKQRDEMYKLIKIVYENSIHVSTDKNKRQQFYKQCFGPLKKLRGSDVRIFQQYGNASQFGIERQVSIIAEIRQQVERKIKEIMESNEYLEKSQIYRDSLIRWLSAHCKALSIMIDLLPSVQNLEQRAEMMKKAIFYYQEEGARDKKRKKHQDVAEFCLKHYLQNVQGSQKQWYR